MDPLILNIKTFTTSHKISQASQQFMAEIRTNMSIIPSKFEYSLLPPMSALTGAPSGLAAQTSARAAEACLLRPVDVAPCTGRLASALPRQSGVGPTLQRHPFSGLVDSAGELLHIPVTI